MIRELVKDIAKYLPSYIVPAIVGILALPIITRLFPPDEYGNYVLVLVTVSILSAITTTWLSASIIRFFPTYKLNNRLREFYGTLIKLTLVSIAVISLIFWGILYLVEGYIPTGICSLMRIGLLVFIASSCSTVLLSFLRAKRQVTWYSSFSIWSSVAGLGLGITLVMVSHYGVDGLLWGSFLSTAIAVPLLWKVAMGRPSFKEGRIRSSMTLEVARYGFPIVIVNIASWILSLSDRYVLELFRGSVEVGIYSASYTISEGTIFMIASLFMLASGPIGYRIWEGQGIEASREFLNKVSRYYLLIGLPATVGLSVLARPVIDVLTAQAYYQGYKIIPLVAFGAFLVGITHRFSEALTFYKRTDILMYCVLGSALLNIGLNFLFIPKYGYMAAAATTLIAFAANLTMVIIMSRRFFIWSFPFKSLGKVVIASAIMGAVVYPVGNSLTSSTLINLIVGICVGVVIYFLMLLLLRELQSGEIKEFVKLVKGLHKSGD